MAFMLFDAYLPSTYAPGCCTNQLYAILLDDSNQALKDNGFGVLTLQSFAAANQNLHAIAMAEAVERTKYFFAKIDTANLSLPALAKGKYYFLEIWRHEGALPRIRSTDELIEARRIQWDGGKLVDAVLSDSGEGAVAGYVAHFASVYNSATLEMHFGAWLEKGGKFISDPIRVNLLWKNATGATLANVTTTSQLAGLAGAFSFSISNVTLQPDAVTFAKVTITDADNVQHESLTSIVSWD